jgi:MarR family transcriptional regulator for hemolysin
MRRSTSEERVSAGEFMTSLTDLVRTTRSSERLLGEWLGELPVGVPGLLILESIDGGVALPSAIAISLQQASPTVSQVVSRLVRDGLVQRSRNPQDGRQRPLALTDAGRDLLEQARSRIASGLDAATKLQDGDVRRLERALGRWSSAMRFDPG